MSQRIDIDGNKTLTIKSEHFGSLFVPSGVRGEFDEREDSCSLTVNNYTKVRDFEVGTHQIVERFEELDDTYYRDMKLSIKCLQCDFDCILTSPEREAAIYAWLWNKPCDEITEEFK